MSIECTVVQSLSRVEPHHRAPSLHYSAGMAHQKQVFKSELHAILAGNIRACIENTPGMTIKKLADRSHVPERTIHSWLSSAASSRSPQISDDLQSVASVFGLDAWALFFPLLTVLSGDEQKETVKHLRKYVRTAAETRKYVDSVMSRELK